MNIRGLLIIAIVFGAFVLSAQVAPDKYYIQFTDKNNSPYSIDHPEDFLTQRAIDRRVRQGIAIDYRDIPVNVTYLQGVADVGVQLLNATRWLNGVTVFTTNSSLITDIEALPYVASTRKFVGTPTNQGKSFFEVEEQAAKDFESIASGLKSISSLDYGYAYGQIEQLNGISLHDQGFQGQGMLIGVLDSGFEDADLHPVFDSLRANGQILGTKDFVNPGGDVYREHYHGKSVLSCMAANSPGEMIGTAPKADYWLCRTEDVASENYIEEFNWVSGAEFLDSLGVDLINSSLSYVGYDMPEWSHDYEDLDGNTAVGSIAADIASAKGILVCNSAGNSGESNFPWNGAPADADSVFSIGSVRLNGSRASSSSIGPTADGRIKPAVMACGYGATVASGSAGIAINGGYGTSYSSPIMTGMITCLWQAFPDLKVMELQEAIKESASHSDDPDNFMGWGIPDFLQAAWLITSINKPEIEGNQLVHSVSPNPFIDRVSIVLNLDTIEQVDLQLHSVNGTELFQTSKLMSPFNNKVDVNHSLSQLPAGIYYLKVRTAKRAEVTKLLKN